MLIKKNSLKIAAAGFAILVIAYIAYTLYITSSYPDISTPKPTFGSPDAKVKIVEFSDLQCPACKAANPVVQKVKKDFGENISFQYYHFPLRALHPYAQKAAEAVECANDQRKFWEYIDGAFAASPRLDRKSLQGVAADVGLDVDKFNACLRSGRKAKIVEGDYRRGIAQGVDGTPTFFVNGKKLERWDYENFVLAIRKASG